MARIKLRAILNMKVSATPTALELIEDLKKLTVKIYYSINQVDVVMEVRQCVIQLKNIWLAIKMFLSEK